MLTHIQTAIEKAETQKLAEAVQAVNIKPELQKSTVNERDSVAPTVPVDKKEVQAQSGKEGGITDLPLLSNWADDVVEPTGGSVPSEVPPGRKNEESKGDNAHKCLECGKADPKYKKYCSIKCLKTLRAKGAL